MKNVPLPPIGTGNTALVIHDMQNDFIGESLATKPEMKDVVTRVRALIDTAHSLSMPVIYTRVESDPALDFPPGRAKYLRWAEGEVCVKGTPGAEIVGELKPGPYDFVITKFRSSAFQDTRMEALLRVKGVWVLVVVGGSTNWGVEWLARDAKSRDILPIVVGDCTYSRTDEAQQASLANIDNFIGHVITWDGVMKLLTKGK